MAWVKLREAYDADHGCKPIKGGKFTFRTFHAPDRGKRSERRTIDRLYTVTLPAVSGEGHTIVPTMEVEL